MRIFKNCGEMISEVARDLHEMGVERRTLTMQDKLVAGDGNYSTKEIFNYSFCITQLNDVSGLFLFSDTKDWADAEFEERVSCHNEGITYNPGEAYKLRKNIWNQFIRNDESFDGTFSYSYSERIDNQIRYIVDRLKVDPGSRQCLLSIWDRKIDIPRMGEQRIPCSIFYHFLAELKGRCYHLNNIYSMRSSDLITHFANDVYLAIKLLKFIAAETGFTPGKLYMNVSSLHYYMRDRAILENFMSQRK